MDDLHAGRSGESGADGRGGGLGAVFSHAGERGRDVTAGRLSGVARERLTEIARGGLSYEDLVWEILRSAIRRAEGAFHVAGARGRRRRPVSFVRRPAPPVVAAIAQ